MEIHSFLEIRVNQMDRCGNVFVQHRSEWKEITDIGGVICYETLPSDSGVLCLDWRQICERIQHRLKGRDEENCDRLETYWSRFEEEYRWRSRLSVEECQYRMPRSPLCTKLLVLWEWTMHSSSIDLSEIVNWPFRSERAGSIFHLSNTSRHLASHSSYISYISYISKMLLYCPVFEQFSCISYISRSVQHSISNYLALILRSGPS